MRMIISLLLMLMGYFTGAQDTTYSNTYHLGSTRVQLSSSCFIPCQQPVVYINVHENESTSVKAAEEFLHAQGGTLVALKHNGERYISFMHKGRSYRFDPNRIYTKKGLTATLKANGAYTPGAEKMVEAFAKEIISKTITGKKLVIALHNNTDKNYSIASYKPGGSEARNTAKLYINPQMDEDDFIVTTNAQLFEQIKEKKINVILQDNKRMVDDGSLSVYAARNNIDYLNIEAQAGHKEIQLAMLETIKEMIEHYYHPKP